MKIRISQADGHEKVRTITVPTRVVFSSVTAAIASHLSKDAVNLTPGQMRRLFRMIRQSRKLLGDLPLVEVLESGGDYVRIDL